MGVRHVLLLLVPDQQWLGVLVLILVRNTVFHLERVQRTPAAADYYVLNLVLQHFETLKHD